MTRRRAFLASVSAAFLAGCTGVFGGGSNATATDTSTERDSSGSGTTTTGGSPTTTPTRTPTETEDDDDGGGLTRITETATENGDRDRDRDDRDRDRDRRTRTATRTERRGTPEGRPDVLLDGRLSILDSEWRRVTIDVDQPATLEYSFRTMRLPIDVYLMTESEYSLFEENESIRYFEEASVLGSRGADVVFDLEVIEDENYVLVFDNTDRGEVGPSRNATVDDEISGTAEVVVYR